MPGGAAVIKLAKSLRNRSGSQQDKVLEKARQNNSQSRPKHSLRVSPLPVPAAKPAVNSTKNAPAAPPPTAAAKSTKKLSYRKTKSSPSSSTSAESSRAQSDNQGSQQTTPLSATPTMDKPLVSLEKRPSITEKELTPIVVNQLHNTRKQKEEMRRTRRGSLKKPEEQHPKQGGEVVTDSGAESASEESRRRTAQLFMTGIQTAITESFDDQKVVAENESQDIVTEVDNVLAKLMASLQKGDSGVPGVPSNIIPLITSLQATLRANQLQDPSQQQQQQLQQLQQLVPQQNNAVQRTVGKQAAVQQSDRVSAVADGKEDQATEQQLVEDDPNQGSKIPWKIRASRKRQQKHLTLGLTREEFANIQETLRNRPVEFPVLQSNAPYSLMRNKSEGQILRSGKPLEPLQQPLQPLPQPVNNRSSDEAGYVSDVCDYNLQQDSDPVRLDGPRKISAPNPPADACNLPAISLDSPKDGGDAATAAVVHGKLSLPITGGARDQQPSTATVKPPGTKTSEVSPVNPNLDNVQKAVLQISGPGTVSGSGVKLSTPGNIISGGGVKLSAPGSDVVGDVVSSVKSKASDEEHDSQMSRQSSVEETKIDGKGRRKSSGGKTSTIKSRIQMRKMMREANRAEIPSGTLSDQDPDNDRDSVEEKQDSESTYDEEILNSKRNEAVGKLTLASATAPLTPESVRRMKDWNSRFSNLKSSFDATSVSDKEEDVAAMATSAAASKTSPNLQRTGRSATQTDTEDRGRRGRETEKTANTKRAQSAHSSFRNTTTSYRPYTDQSPSMERPQSKDDKNKNNALIANINTRRVNEGVNKEKSPSARRFEETDDEYLQYLNSVDRYRQSNPNPKPFRPVTTRSDAIANPIRKTSEGPVPVKHSTPQAKSKQTTPVRDGDKVVRISKSVPKEVNRPKMSVREETQAEILGLVRTNKETGMVEKTNDMDYEDYMNIINRVRKTKEFTRVRTEQARLASMYAQEKKRQEEIKLEEERLRLERERFEEERKRSTALIPPVVVELHPPEEAEEKGQLDNKEQEQGIKVSPGASQTTEISTLQTSSTQERSKRAAPETRPEVVVRPAAEKSEGGKAEDPGKPEAARTEPPRKEDEEKLRLAQIRDQQIRQQKLREEQVLAEQRKLEQLREEQLRQEEEREEIRRLEIERLKQIQEDQQRLEDERRRQQEQIRLEQLRLEEEKRKQEQLQRERQEQYQKQEEEMIAKARAAEAKKLEMERLKVEQLRQTSMSPHEKLIQDRLRQQERLREEQLMEEAQIRQEKLNLIRQEETLLMRQEEMLKQIQEEKMKLLKQEDMIRSRQQDRLKQVRAEKALLEKQEQMLKLREEQLVQERRRQEKLREEAIILRRQEEEIRRRQEEIAKELMKGDMSLDAASEEVMVCQAREGQVFQGRKPHYPETVLDRNVVDVQQLSTSDWSSSEAESLMPNQMGAGFNKSMQDLTTYLEANENYDSNPFKILASTEEETKNESGSSEEEDTMEEDCYECKVEVKQQNTQVPTSVRTIETVIDVPGWAPVTPYLNVSKNVPTPTSQEEISQIFSESKSQSMQYKTAGIVTSPESVMTSTNLITTPDSSVSLQSQMSNNDNEFSSCAPSPIPPIPPLPKDSKDLMTEHFQTVQPDVPPRDDSFNITAVYTSDAHSIFTEQAIITSQAPGQRKSLIETNRIPIPTNVAPDPQLSPRLGGPGSAFRPYASSENLFDPNLFPTTKPPLSNHNGHPNSGEKMFKRHSTSSLKPPKILESDEDFFKPRAKQLKAPIMSTTDTEPEMKEFNLGPIGSDKKGKKHQKTFYSTSETEEEYQAYLKSKPKWHGKGGHKDSWDPLQIASPPQIVQRPVGVVQKPKPQAKQPVLIERGAEFMGAMAGAQKQFYSQLNMNAQNSFDPDPNSLMVPDSMERIQKSDSIIELRQKNSLGGQAEPARVGESKQPTSLKSMSISPGSNMENKRGEEVKPQITDVASRPGPVPVRNSSMLQIPQVASPPDSEDQTTPQAPRRQFLPNQMSVDSVNSFSETEESNENLAPQIKSNKEDPETKKKKEIHKNLMSEALKKVELRNNQKKNFSQLSRTNPTIAALDIVTRKELKMEELENKQEQEILRNRNRSGSNKIEETAKSNPGVNQNVLQSFRQQSIHKGGSASNQSFASREAAIQAKKAGTPAKSEPNPPTKQPAADFAAPPPTDAGEPVVILKKQPRILDQSELQARQTSIDRVGSKGTPSLEVRSGVKSPDHVPAAAVQQVKLAEKPTESRSSSNKEIKRNEQAENPVLKKAPTEKESNCMKAAEKISAVQQKNNQNAEQKISVKQTLQGVVQVKPKNPVRAEQESKTPDSHNSRLKKTQTSEENVSVSNNHDNNNNSSSASSNNKNASVKKAAEKYENRNITPQESNSANSHLRLRSKSIGNSRKDQFEEGSATAKLITKANLPWAAKSPPAVRKRDAMRNKGYALQMSKSSDSITAAKMLAKARAENSNSMGGLRINQNFSKSIENQIDVYSKTKEEIRMILSLAKSGSVNDRIALFSNMVTADKPAPDPDAKAESIRREIEEARANAQETVSDTEIEFQEPVESKVKPLKIPMKPKLIDKSELGPESSLRINQGSSTSAAKKERRQSIEELPSVKSKISNYLSATEESVASSSNGPSSGEAKPKPILVNRGDKERSRSPRKKTPKLVSDHLLAPDQSFQIYTQSATDMSATEDESELSKHSGRRVGGPMHLSAQDPGPGFLKVPPPNNDDRRHGIMKSKSFAATGQFEGTIDSSLVTAKKQTMMSFFQSPDFKPKSIMKQPSRPQRRSSLSSITDEVLVEEEDLQDIDAEFESLLTRTFEQESKSQLLMRGGGDAVDSGKGKGGGGSSSRSATGQNRAPVGPGRDSRPVQVAANATKLQKSKSFSATASAGPQQQAGEVNPGDNMQQISQQIRQGFDPIAALPSSSSSQSRQQQQQRRGGLASPPQHSPSPTQNFNRYQRPPRPPSATRPYPGQGRGQPRYPGHVSGQYQQQIYRMNCHSAPCSPNTGRSFLPGSGAGQPTDQGTGNFLTPNKGAVAARSGSGAKEMIMNWVQMRLKDYPIPMTNFSSCWNDGLAFCALIHVFYPEAFDWYALSSSNRRYNFTLAFDKAEELADIYPLLEVDDMVRFKKPDWKCVFTYVQSFYRRFRDGRSPPPRTAGKPAPSASPAMSAVAQAVADETTARTLKQQTVQCEQQNSCRATTTSTRQDESKSTEARPRPSALVIPPLSATTAVTAKPAAGAPTSRVPADVKTSQSSPTGLIKLSESKLQSLPTFPRSPTKDSSQAGSPSSHSGIAARSPTSPSWVRSPPVGRQAPPSPSWVKSSAIREAPSSPSWVRSPSSSRDTATPSSPSWLKSPTRQSPSSPSWPRTTTNSASSARSPSLDPPSSPSWVRSADSDRPISPSMIKNRERSKSPGFVAADSSDKKTAAYQMPSHSGSQDGGQNGSRPGGQSGQTGGQAGGRSGGRFEQIMGERPMSPKVTLTPPPEDRKKTSTVSRSEITKEEILEKNAANPGKLTEDDLPDRPPMPSCRPPDIKTIF